MNPAFWMPLNCISSGLSVVVRSIRDGGGLTSRLTAMGMLPGVTLQVYRNDRTEPVVLELNGCRVMLGQRIAAKVWVQENGRHT